MSTFARELDVGQLLEHVRRRPDGAVASLFENWVLPGERPRREGKLGLRMAIRNGYVNFYVNGQSVAKLSSSPRKLEIETHWKYHQGVHKNATGAQEGKLYARFRGEDLDSRTAEDVARWTAAAATYASAEKTFVDRLVTRNRNVVDLEIGLPGPTAPRMDLAVVVERDGRSAIHFWEAKCVDNGELRASPHLSPKVFAQAKKYQDWLSVDDQYGAVQKAYRRTGEILQDLTKALVELDGSRFWQLERFDPRVSRLADQMPEVILAPGLVVGAYCPTSWLRRHPNADTAVARFAGKLRSYRAGETSHEERIKAEFSNYVCYESGGTTALPEPVA